MDYWRKRREKKGQHHPDLLPKLLSKVGGPHPTQQPSRTQVVSGSAEHENPPRGQPSYAQQNPDQPCASAPNQQEPSETGDNTSRAIRLSSVKGTRQGREGKETPPTIEELHQVFEHFKMDPYSKSNFPDVIQYVHSLQAENNTLARSRDEARTALGSFGNTAMFLISNLHPPGVMEDMSQKDQFTASGALDFLLGHYKSLWETNSSNCDRIGNMDGENKHLRQELHKQDIWHRQQVGQIKRECQSYVDDEELRHSTERDEIRALHNNQLQKLGYEHEREINELNLGHQNSIAVLIAGHQKALADLRAKLEEDIRTLEDALMSFVDRFKPKSDAYLRSQFDDLKAWVGKVARFPLDVDAEELGERLDQTAFIRLAPPRHHKFALESSIWTILVDGIFATPFKIFDDHSGHFSTLWSRVTQEDQRPINPDFEKWKSITFESLRYAVIENTIKRPADDMIRQNYETNVAKVFQSLSALFRRISSQDRHSEIRNIVDKACSVAFDWGEQRCRLELFAPGLKHKVSRQNTKTYEDMNGDNDPSLAEGIVQLVVSPGFRRTGRGRGSSLDEVLDLYPATVYLTETG